MDNLDITNRDIRDFKRMVTEQAAGTLNDEESSLFDNYHYPPNEIDQYSFYQNIAKNLDTVSAATIDRVFDEQYRFVTHMTHNRLKIFFEDNTIMTIVSCNYRPGFFHTPLLIEYEGLLFNSKSVKLGKLIDKLTKGTFLQPYSKQGKYAILRIAEYLYEREMEKNAG